MVFLSPTRKILLIPVLLIMGLCGFSFGPNPDKLFDEACKTLSLTTLPATHDKATAGKVLAAYGPAAKAGHIESMLLCQFVLENSDQMEKIYPYLQPLETMKSGDRKIRRKNFDRMGLKGISLSDDDIMNVMLSRLCKLHLTGCGTEQSYVKARSANAGVSEDGQGHAPLRVKDEYFATPDTIEAQEAFWTLARDTPGAELFLVNRIALGDSSAYLNLSPILEKKSPEEQLAFYEQHAGKAKDLGRKAALIYLEKDYSPENLAKARKALGGATDAEPSAKALADALPESLSDTQKLEQTAEYFRNETVTPPPRWLAAATANKIDAGALDKTLAPGFTYTPNAEEVELINNYSSAADKKAFLESAFKKLKDDAPAFRFHVYKDLEEKNPKLLTAFTGRINPSSKLDKYPPYALHMTQYYRARGLKNNANPTDFAAAEKLAKQAAEQGYPPAMALYGYMLAFLNDKKDQPKGFELCLQAARMGDPEALKHLLLLPDNGADKTAREIKLLTRSAELGNAEAVRLLDSQYNVIFQADPNMLLSDSIKQDDIFNVSREGLELVKNSGDSPENLLKGMSLLWYAASKEDVLSMMVLGDLLYSGIILPQDFERARFYYVRVLKALPPNTCDAIWPVGEMLLLGLGVDQNIAEAKRVLAMKSCPSDWDEELAKEAIPPLAKTSVPHPGFEPRHKPDLEYCGLEGKTFPLADVDQVRSYGESKEELLKLLTGKR